MPQEGDADQRAKGESRAGGGEAPTAGGAEELAGLCGVDWDWGGGESFSVFVSFHYSTIREALANSQGILGNITTVSEKTQDWGNAVSKNKFTIVMFVITLVAGYVYWINKLPEGIETKGESEAVAWVSLATAVVSLVTAIVTLVSSTKGEKPKESSPNG